MSRSHTSRNAGGGSLQVSRSVKQLKMVQFVFGLVISLSSTIVFNWNLTDSDNFLQILL